MTTDDLFSFIYVVLGEEVGGLQALETQIDAYMKKVEEEAFINSDARFAPDRQLPEEQAAQTRAAMALGGMARPREK